MICTLAAVVALGISFVGAANTDDANANSIAESLIDYEISRITASLQHQIAACPALPPRPSPPTDVRDVRLDDISVVIGMGDSVTSALNTRFKYSHQFNNETVRKIVLAREFRGTNFVNGNDPDAFSVAMAISNVRKKQGRNEVYGMAEGTAPLQICFGSYCPYGTSSQPFTPEIGALDAAQSGALITKGNIDNQMKYLDMYYDIFVPEQDPKPWKLVIYDTGLNNLCLACNPLFNALQFSADIYEQNVRYMLEEVRSRYTNVIVMLLGPFNLPDLQKIITKDPVCKEIYSGSVQACFCLFFKPEITGPQLSEMVVKYNERLLKITNDYRQKNYTDFGVVYDPGFSKMDVSNMTISENLSGMDCYHPNVASHSQFAAYAWNNLVLPQAQKKQYRLDPEFKLTCPSATDRISLE